MLTRLAYTAARILAHSSIQILSRSIRFLCLFIHLYLSRFLPYKIHPDRIPEEFLNSSAPRCWWCTRRANRQRCSKDQRQPGADWNEGAARDKAVKIRSIFWQHRIGKMNQIRREGQPGCVYTLLKSWSLHPNPIR